MDISSLKAYSASLTDFLGKGNKAGYFDDIANTLMSTVSQLSNPVVTDAETTGGDSVTLSADAQALLAQGASGDDSKQSGVQKAASNFMMSFFDQSGLDLSKLSDNAVDIITGLQGVIGSSAATGRDLTTDMAEEKYAAGTKKVFTLAGNGTRLRLAIDYQDGKPTKLSITDITGGKVETAEITVNTADGTQNGTLAIDRTQREYNNGALTSMTESDPLEVDLYAAS